ncbi:MAG: aromatic ring-hydroxylating dioxygenase subunit alpha [Kiloniellales bacterium]
MLPISQASGLPNQAYTSADYALFERDHLLAHTWTCIGTGASIAGPGDARPLSLMGLPLLLLRDHQSTIKVFHNVCSHRGMELLSAPAKLGKGIRCPYHSWVYDLDGRLRATPHLGGPGQRHCDGFQPQRHGLRAVRSAVWFDQVFVDLSGTAPPFDEFVAPLAARWAAFDPALLRHGGDDSRFTIELQCNWKLAVENYCEAYHLPWVHPGLNSYSRLEDHYNIMFDDRFSGQGSRVYNPRLAAEGPDFPHFPGLPTEWNKQAEYIALYPNLLLGVHRDHIYAVRIEPLGPDRTREHFEIYYVGEMPLDEAYRARRVANAAAWRQVFEEDRGVVEGMQRGRASPAFSGGAFSPAMDGPTHCFHRWVAGQLARILTRPAASPQV